MYFFIAFGKKKLSEGIIVNEHQLCEANVVNEVDVKSPVRVLWNIFVVSTSVILL